MILRSNLRALQNALPHRLISTKRPTIPEAAFTALGTDLTPDALGPESQTRAVIDGLGPTSFTISGVRVSGSVLIMPRFSTLWNVQCNADISPAAFTLVKLIAPRPDLVVVGTGTRLVPASREVYRFFKEIGVSFEAMDTKNACHTFNVLNQESRVVAAALLPVGHIDNNRPS